MEDNINSIIDKNTEYSVFFGLYYFGLYCRIFEVINGHIYLYDYNDVNYLIIDGYVMVYASSKDIRVFAEKLETTNSIFQYVISLQLSDLLQGTHHGWKRQNGNMSSTLDVTAHDIVNYTGLAKGDYIKTLLKPGNNVLIHKIIYQVLGGKDDLMQHNVEIADYELHRGGLHRLNQVFNEIESHYMHYNPKIWSALVRFLKRHGSIKDIFCDKKMKIRGKELKFTGIRLDESMDQDNEHYSKALDQMTEFVRVIGLLQCSDMNMVKTDGYDKGHYPYQLERDLYGNLINLFMIRMELDLSMLYQKRQTIFTTLIKDILRDPCIGVQNKEIKSPKEVGSDTTFEDYVYKIAQPITITVGGRVMKCVFYGRTKSAKSIIDKLQTNANYGFMEAMNDLFAFTICPENEEDVPYVTAYLHDMYRRSSFNYQTIIYPEHSRFSSKGGCIEAIRQAVQQSNDEFFELYPIPFDLYGKGKSTKQTTHSGYSDCKGELDILVDGHRCGVEIKVMTQAMFDLSNTDPDIGGHARKIKNKTSKDGRQSKLLSWSYVQKICRKLAQKRSYAGTMIDPDRIVDYMTDALIPVTFSSGKELYCAFLPKNNQKRMEKIFSSDKDNHAYSVQTWDDKEIELLKKIVARYTS